MIFIKRFKFYLKRERVRVRFSKKINKVLFIINSCLTIFRSHLNTCNIRLYAHNFETRVISDHMHIILIG